MISKFKRIIAACTVIIFAFTQAGDISPLWAGMPTAAGAAEVDIPRLPFQFEIPPELGAVVDIFSGDGPAIIHLQTAHGNYEAQKKIQALLHYLHDHHGISLLLLEGSSLKLRPELIRFFPERMDVTMEALDQLARQALVKGPELFLAEQKSAEAFGIESLPAYLGNAEAFREVHARREESGKFLEAMDLQIRRLTAAYASRELRSFLNRCQAYEEGRVSPLEWFFHLKAQAEKYLEIDLDDPRHQLEWPMLMRIFKLREFEARLDREALESEKREFLQALKGRLERPENGSLFSEIEKMISLPLSHHKLPDPETGILFETMVSRLPPDFDYARYPNLALWVGHLIFQSEIRPDALARESRLLAVKIQDALARTGVEKDLAAILGDYRLLKRLFNLELTPDDYGDFQGRENGGDRSGKYRPAAIADRFLGMNPQGRVRDLEFRGVDTLEALYESAIRFYEGVVERDGFMLRNIENILRETGKDKAVVVTGGFHSRPFRDYFESRGYRYALVSPEIRELGGRELYIRSVMDYQFGGQLLSSATLETPAFTAFKTDELRQQGVAGVDRLIEALQKTSREALRKQGVNVTGDGLAEYLSQTRLAGTAGEFAAATSRLRHELRDAKSDSYSFEQLLAGLHLQLAQIYYDTDVSLERSGIGLPLTMYAEALTALEKAHHLIRSIRDKEAAGADKKFSAEQAERITQYRSRILRRSLIGLRRWIQTSGLLHGDFRLDLEETSEGQNGTLSLRLGPQSFEPDFRISFARIPDQKGVTSRLRVSELLMREGAAIPETVVVLSYFYLLAVHAELSGLDLEAEKNRAREAPIFFEALIKLKALSAKNTRLDWTDYPLAIAPVDRDRIKELLKKTEEFLVTQVNQALSLGRSELRTPEGSEKPRSAFQRAADNQTGGWEIAGNAHPEDVDFQLFYWEFTNHMNPAVMGHIDMQPGMLADLVWRVFVLYQEIKNTESGIGIQLTDRPRADHEGGGQIPFSGVTEVVMMAPDRPGLKNDIGQMLKSRGINIEDEFGEIVFKAGEEGRDFYITVFNVTKNAAPLPPDRFMSFKMGFSRAAGQGAGEPLSERQLRGESNGYGIVEGRAAVLTGFSGGIKDVVYNIFADTSHLPKSERAREIAQRRKQDIEQFEAILTRTYQEIRNLPGTFYIESQSDRKSRRKLNRLTSHIVGFLENLAAETLERIHQLVLDSGRPLYQTSSLSVFLDLMTQRRRARTLPKGVKAETWNEIEQRILNDLRGRFRVAPAGGTEDEHRQLVQGEVRRFREAVEQVLKNLTRDKPQKTVQRLQGIIAAIELEGGIRDRIIGVIERKGMTSEEAILEVIVPFVESAHESTWEKTAENARDIEIIFTNVYRLLRGKEPLRAQIFRGQETGDMVLFASDINLFDVIGKLEEFPGTRLIVTEGILKSSHSVMMAKDDFGVPTLIVPKGTLDSVLREIQVGAVVAVNLSSGTLYINPSEETRAQIEEASEIWEAIIQVARDQAGLPAMTETGRRIYVGGSADKPERVEAAFENGAYGMRLIRTEYLFTGNILEAYVNDPSEENREALIRYLESSFLEIADKAPEGALITLRMFDMQRDKLKVMGIPNPDGIFGPDFYGTDLGKRLLEIELIAAFQAAAKSEKGKIRILFPMFRSPQDLKVKAGVRTLRNLPGDKQEMLVAQVREDVVSMVSAFEEAKKIAAARLGERATKTGEVRRGFMVEMTEAYLAFEHLLEYSDFVSVGSSDFLLSLFRDLKDISRDNPQYAHIFHKMQTSFLEKAADMMNRVSSHNTRAAKAVGLDFCGVAAGHRGFPGFLERTIPYNVEVGISLSPDEIALTKLLIRNIRAGDTEVFERLSSADFDPEEAARVMLEKLRQRLEALPEVTEAVRQIREAQAKPEESVPADLHIPDASGVVKLESPEGEEVARLSVRGEGASVHGGESAVIQRKNFKMGPQGLHAKPATDAYKILNADFRDLPDAKLIAHDSGGNETVYDLWDILSMLMAAAMPGSEVRIDLKTGNAERAAAFFERVEALVEAGDPGKGERIFVPQGSQETIRSELRDDLKLLSEEQRKEYAGNLRQLNKSSLIYSVVFTLSAVVLTWLGGWPLALALLLPKTIYELAKFAVLAGIKFRSRAKGEGAIRKIVFRPTLGSWVHPVLTHEFSLSPKQRILIDASGSLASVVAAGMAILAAAGAAVTTGLSFYAVLLVSGFVLWNAALAVRNYWIARSVDIEELVAFLPRGQISGMPLRFYHFAIATDTARRIIEYRKAVDVAGAFTRKKFLRNVLGIRVIDEGHYLFRTEGGIYLTSGIEKEESRAAYDNTTSYLDAESFGPVPVNFEFGGKLLKLQGRYQNVTVGDSRYSLYRVRENEFPKILYDIQARIPAAGKEDSRQPARAADKPVTAPVEEQPAEEEESPRGVLPAVDEEERGIEQALIELKALHSKETSNLFLLIQHYVDLALAGISIKQIEQFVKAVRKQINEEIKRLALYHGLEPGELKLLRDYRDEVLKKLREDLEAGRELSREAAQSKVEEPSGDAEIAQLAGNLLKMGEGDEIAAAAVEEQLNAKLRERLEKEFKELGRDLKELTFEIPEQVDNLKWVKNIREWLEESRLPEAEKNIFFNRLELMIAPVRLRVWRDVSRKTRQPRPSTGSGRKNPEFAVRKELDQAKDLMRQKRFRDAFEIYSSVATRSSLENLTLKAEGALGAGKSLSNLKLYDEAYEQFISPALEWDPYNPFLRMEGAWVLIYWAKRLHEEGHPEESRGKYGEALAHANFMLNAEPTNQPAIKVKLIAMLELGERPELIEQLIIWAEDEVFEAPLTEFRVELDKKRRRSELRSAHSDRDAGFLGDLEAVIISSRQSAERLSGLIGFFDQTVRRRGVRAELRVGADNLYEEQARRTVRELKVRVLKKISSDFELPRGEVVRILTGTDEGGPTEVDAGIKTYLEALMFFELIKIFKDESAWLGEGAIDLGREALKEESVREGSEETAALMMLITGQILELYGQIRRDLESVKNLVSEGIRTNKPLYSEIVDEIKRWGGVLRPVPGKSIAPSERIRNFTGLMRRLLENQTRVLALYYQLSDIARRSFQPRSEMRGQMLSEPEKHFAGWTMVESWPLLAVSPSQKGLGHEGYRRAGVLLPGSVEEFLARKSAEEIRFFTDLRRGFAAGEVLPYSRWEDLRRIYSRENVEKVRAVTARALKYLERVASQLGEENPEEGVKMRERILRLSEPSRIAGVMMPMLFFYSFLEQGEQVEDIDLAWEDRSSWDLRKTWIDLEGQMLFFPARWALKIDPDNPVHLSLLASGLYKGQYLIDEYQRLYRQLDPENLTEEQYVREIRGIYEQIGGRRGHDDYPHKEEIFRSIPDAEINQTLGEWIREDLQLRAEEATKIEFERDRTTLDAVAMDQWQGELRLDLLHAVARELEALGRHYDHLGEGVRATLFFNEARRMYKRYQEVDDQGLLPAVNQYQLLSFLLRVGLWSEFLEEFNALLSGKAFKNPGNVLQSWYIDELERIGGVRKFLYELEAQRANYSAFPEKQQEIDSISRQVIREHRRSRGETYEALLSPKSGDVTDLTVVIAYASGASNIPVKSERARNLELIKTRLGLVMRDLKNEGHSLGKNVRIRLEYFYEDSTHEVLLRRIRQGKPIHLLILGKGLSERLDREKDLSREFGKLHPLGIISTGQSGALNIQFKLLRKALEKQIAHENRYGRHFREPRAEIRDSDDNTASGSRPDLTAGLLRSEIRLVAETYTDRLLRERLRRLGEDTFRAMVAALLPEAQAEILPPERSGAVAPESRGMEMSSPVWRPEKAAEARRRIGLGAAETADAYLIGTGFAFDYRGLATLHAVFGDQPFVVIAPTDDRRELVERYNREVLIPQNKFPVLAVSDPSEVRTGLREWFLSRGFAASRMPRSVRGIFSTGDLWLAQALKEQIGDNYIHVTPQMFTNLVKVSSYLDRLIREFTAQFMTGRSA